MKKNYIVPSTELCDMEVMNIIATSDMYIEISDESADPELGGAAKAQGNLWDTEW